MIDTAVAYAATSEQFCHVIGYFQSVKHRLAFVFIDAATAGLYTLSLHDALPISAALFTHEGVNTTETKAKAVRPVAERDRKSTRLNSSHTVNSYAVFCLKKKITSEQRELAAALRDMFGKQCPPDVAPAGAVAATC